MQGKFKNMKFPNTYVYHFQLVWILFKAVNVQDIVPDTV